MSKILICSLEEGIRESLKLLLEDRYELIVTDSTDMCLEVVNNADIRLLLLDTSQLNEVPKIVSKLTSSKPKLKIVVTTNHKQENLAQDAIRAGATGYIVK